MKIVQYVIGLRTYLIARFFNKYLSYFVNKHTVWKNIFSLVNNKANICLKIKVVLEVCLKHNVVSG